MVINILLCDTFPGLLPREIPSYVSMFTSLFDAVAEGTEYRVFRAMDGELPVLKEGEGYLITGCNRGAYEDIPWIRKLLEWIVEARREGVKLTGICFGHQAVAQALGGLVERSGKGWGTGIRECEIVDPEGLGYFPDGRMRLLYNHHDQVVRLPEGAEIVARSGFCPVESFRIGDRILTFQGHPEYVPEYSRHLLENFADGEPKEVKDKALESLRTMSHQGRTVARWIVDMFRDCTSANQKY